RREREALLPSAGQRAGELVLPPREPEVVDRAIHRGLAIVHRIHARGELEILADREVLPEGESLRHVTDVALDELGLPANVVAEAGAAAGVRREETAHEADRRRLAAAVRSEEAEDLALHDAHREVDHDVL